MQGCPARNGATFLALFPTHRQPAQPPWRLALVTRLQFAEGLSDRHAANPVRSRIDWQHVLRLEFTDAGFDASVLSEFCSRLITGAAESLRIETLLSWCRDRQLVKARGRQRTDSTHILVAIRTLNRIELDGRFQGLRRRNGGGLERNRATTWRHRLQEGANV